MIRLVASVVFALRLRSVCPWSALDDQPRGLLSTDGPDADGHGAQGAAEEDGIAPAYDPRALEVCLFASRLPK